MDQLQMHALTAIGHVQHAELLEEMDNVEHAPHPQQLQLDQEWRKHAAAQQESMIQEAHVSTAIGHVPHVELLEEMANVEHALRQL